MKTTVIDDLVGVLSVRNKKALDEFQKVIPDARVMLADDGSDPSELLASLSSAQAAALFELAKKALSELQPCLYPAVEQIRRKLKIIGGCSLTGQVLAVLGSSGASVVLLKSGGAAAQVIASITALVAFFGSALSLVLQFMKSDLTGTENGSAKQYSELRDLIWQVRVVMAQLGVIRIEGGSGISAAEIKVISEANSLAGKAHRLLVDVGFPLKLVE